MKTKGFIQNAERVGLSPRVAETMQKNADGSCDVSFAPTAPEGMESNWIRSAPGKGWNTILRLYGPLEAWFEPGDFELIK